MVIKTDRDWPIYTCPNCGLEYYFKYSDSGLCATCRCNERYIIEAILQGVNKSDIDSIIEFNKSYINSKKIDSVKVEVKETKNKYGLKKTKT